MEFSTRQWFRNTSYLSHSIRLISKGVNYKSHGPHVSGHVLSEKSGGPITKKQKERMRDNWPGLRLPTYNNYNFACYECGQNEKDRGRKVNGKERRIKMKEGRKKGREENINKGYGLLVFT